MPGTAPTRSRVPAKSCGPGAGRRRDWGGAGALIQTDRIAGAITELGHLVTAARWVCAAARRRPASQAGSRRSPAAAGHLRRVCLRSAMGGARGCRLHRLEVLAPLCQLALAIQAAKERTLGVVTDLGGR
jgi:hypothetical protein